jgi:hypothetical protein
LGGEEFVLLLTETSETQAKAAANKIRETIEHSPLMYSGETISLTISGGIAEYGAHGDSLQALIRQADRCLYHAKQTGRNQIIHLEDAPDASPAHSQMSDDGTKHRAHHKKASTAIMHYFSAPICRLLAHKEGVERPEPARLRLCGAENQNWQAPCFGSRSRTNCQVTDPSF